MKRGGIILIIILMILVIEVIRVVNPSQLDDVHPEIPCPELNLYNPDILYAIPNYNNTPISHNKTWCNYILSLNKTIEMHGIKHNPYQEFLTENITQEQIETAINEFQKCFNQTPENFKPPQLKISPENKELIQNNNLKLETGFNQLTHKVYHCNDTGKIKNKWINIL